MRFPILALAVAALALLVAAGDADAKRLGGGRSFGAQRQGVAPPAFSPGPAANPVLPAQPGAGAAKPVAPAPPAGGSRWLGPIAGIAAGLGLAALLAHFGLPEGFGNVLLLAIVALGAVLLLRALTARRAPAAAGIPAGSAWNAPPSPRSRRRRDPSAARPARFRQVSTRSGSCARRRRSSGSSRPRGTRATAGRSPA